MMLEYHLACEGVETGKYVKNDDIEAHRQCQLSFGLFGVGYHNKMVRCRGVRRLKCRQVMAQMRDQDYLMDYQVIYLSIVRVGVSQSSTDR